MLSLSVGWILSLAALVAQRVFGRLPSSGEHFFKTKAPRLRGFGFLC
jgi:hypothetical protein